MKIQLHHVREIKSNDGHLTIILKSNHMIHIAYEQHATIHITDEQFADKVAGGGIFVTYPHVSSDQAIVSIKTNIMNSGDQSARIKVMQSLKQFMIVMHKILVRILSGIIMVYQEMVLII